MWGGPPPAASGAPATSTTCSTFADGGPTAVDYGILIWPRHHTAVREGGVRITGDPNGTVTLHRPDGSVLGTSTAGRIDPPEPFA
jgi:hypothetical protein